MAWVCASCNNLVDNHLPSCNACGLARSDGGGPGFAAGESAADWRDLAMEGHLRAIAFWYRFSAVLCVPAAAGLMIFGGSLEGSSGLGAMAGTLLMVVGVIVLCCAVGSYLLGHFLARYANGARITAGVFTSIGLGMNVLSACGGAALMSAGHRGYDVGSGVGNLFGSLISIGMSLALLWAFFSKRSAHLCTPQYRELVAKSPQLKPRTWTSPFFLVPLILIIIFVVIGGAAIALVASRAAHF